MDSWATVQVWILVLCEGPSSHNVFASSCFTSSDSIAKRQGGPTLGGALILFSGKASAGNPRFGFILGCVEGFSVPLGTLGVVKGGTGG